MNVKPNLHNFVVIGVVAVLFLLALKLLSRTGLANVPVIGPMLQTGAAA